MHEKAKQRVEGTIRTQSTRRVVKDALQRVLARVVDAELYEFAPSNRPLLPRHAVVYAW